MSTWQVILLGLLEGLTEFIPVSSTGHLLLAGHFLGFKSPGKTFEVLIQLGAILAILSVYSAKLLRLLIDLPQRCAHAPLRAGGAGCLPAGGGDRRGRAQIHQGRAVRVAVARVHDADRGRRRPADRRQDAAASRAITTPWTCRSPRPSSSAFAQCLAMIPGVSRSGSSIVGALLLGADKRAATEFSFFLAMPTMVGRLRLRPLQELRRA